MVENCDHRQIMMKKLMFIFVCGMALWLAVAVSAPPESAEERSLDTVGGWTVSQNPGVNTKRYKFGFMAALAYRSRNSLATPVVSGWNFDHFQSDREVKVFQANNGAWASAFRGTEATDTDNNGEAGYDALTTDRAMVFVGLYNTKRFISMICHVRQLKDKNDLSNKYYTCGHSLGGSLSLHVPHYLTKYFGLQEHTATFAANPCICHCLFVKGECRKQLYYNDELIMLKQRKYKITGTYDDFASEPIYFPRTGLFSNRGFAVSAEKAADQKNAAKEGGGYLMMKGRWWFRQVHGDPYPNKRSTLGGHGSANYYTATDRDRIADFVSSEHDNDPRFLWCIHGGSANMCVAKEWVRGIHDKCWDCTGPGRTNGCDDIVHDDGLNGSVKKRSKWALAGVARWTREA